MLYLQMYFTNFHKLFSRERRRRCLLVWKFQVQKYFGSPIATIQVFQNPENVKISIFPFTQSQQKCYISKRNLRIFINFFSREKAKVSIVVENFKCTVCTVPAEMLYPHKYLTNFQKLFLAERRRRCLLWLKISSAQIFWFCNSNVTTFPKSRKCKNFNFSFYTVPAEMLYLQKYLTKFQKLFFGSKKRNLATVVENLKGTDILVLQKQC